MDISETQATFRQKVQNAVKQMKPQKTQKTKRGAFHSVDLGIV